jgi:sporulation protein YlmC with PRC-barrel domain
MKRSRQVAMLLAVGMAAMSSPAARTQGVNIVEVDVKAVGRGYRVSKLIGRDVVNEQNEHIGQIDDFIIGRDQVLFVILQIGGYLGLGARLVAMPADAIDMETVKGRIRIRSASRLQLQKMPEFKYGKAQGQTSR